MPSQPCLMPDRACCAKLWAWLLLELTHLCNVSQQHNCVCLMPSGTTMHFRHAFTCDFFRIVFTDIETIISAGKEATMTRVNCHPWTNAATIISKQSSLCRPGIGSWAVHGFWSGWPYQSKKRQQLLTHFGRNVLDAHWLHLRTPLNPQLVPACVDTLGKKTPNRMLPGLGSVPASIFLPILLQYHKHEVADLMCDQYNVTHRGS
jgi:hypothetical protein